VSKTDDALVHEVFIEDQLATLVELGHPGTGTGAAGRAVEHAGIDDRRVLGVRPIYVGFSREDDVLDLVDLRVAGVFHAHLLLDGTHDLHPRLHELLRVPFL
jgi:hypothetical protein